MVPVNRVDMNALSRFTRFANLPQARVSRLAVAMSAWRFERRERIYQQGEASRSLYILLRGSPGLAAIIRLRNSF
jgi:CRP-like cAMP-binding protein